MCGSFFPCATTSFSIVTSYSPLAPIFSESTPLHAPKGTALRRALVQPALKCGYRFEDESLVEEMIAEVSEERGALPLLAFAAAQLWEHRDREQGLTHTRSVRAHRRCRWRVGPACRGDAGEDRQRPHPHRAGNLPQSGHRPRNPCRPRHGGASFRIRRQRRGRRSLARAHRRAASDIVRSGRRRRRRRAPSPCGDHP